MDDTCLVSTAIALLLVAVPTAAAQDLPLATDVPVPDVPAYVEDTPQPQSVIGHRIGTRHSTPAEVVRYFRRIAETSERVRLKRHARSYEGRPLVHAVVTAPENMDRLGEIRRQSQRLTEAPESVSEDEIEDMPGIVYMGYGVHGDEASTSEAAMLLLYHLAAARSGDVAEMLEDMVILVDPLFNPDGRDRFVDWVNGNRGGPPTADPQDREHNQPWPTGRTNHYWFDLNRDWLPAQHPESQGRLRVFHRWRPQVLTDYHEMGKNGTYFFQPGIPSRTNPLTPDRNQELTAEIAEYHAEALNEVGALYYSEESYDDFYYGKGSTYPDVNGTIGILFEQASSRALKQKTNDGVLTYGETIRNHFATSLSTLHAARSMREKLLRHTRGFYAGAEEWAARQDVQGYVVSLAEERTKAQAMAKVLRRHRVKLHELERPLEADGRSFQPGRAYVVPMRQKQARLVRAFMERRVSFPDSLFYDVSTWTLPLAFGVEYAELSEHPADYLGDEIQNVTFDGGRVVGGEAEYAYVLPWERYFAPRALHGMQEAGLKPRLMTKPFSAGVDDSERSFERGSIVVPLRRQSGLSADSVHYLVRELAERDHVRFYALDSGLTPDGPDLGGRSGEVLDEPKVGLVVGEGTRAYNAGEVWHLLSERFRMPVSLLNAGDVGGMDLSRYDVIVLAGGRYGPLPGDDVEAWVRDGGRLVAQAGAVGWVNQTDLADLNATSGASIDSAARELPYNELRRAYGAQYIGGAIFEGAFDVTHPLAYGLDRRVALFRRGVTFYETPGEPGRTVGTYPDAPLLSGYAPEEKLEAASGAAALVAREPGRGKVVLIMDNPNFRAFWYGTNRLLLNAIFLGGAF
jgi:hypothetical protein